MSPKEKLKQSAHALETEDLLNILESSDTQDTEEFTPLDSGNDVLDFILEFNIEPGEEKIKQYTLFSIYKAWSKAPIKKVDFINEMMKYYKVGKLNQTRAYLINQNAVKITHKAYKYFSNNNTKIKQKTWANHYENFLRFHSITQGTYWIHSSILYFIYDKYCHATGLDKNVLNTLKKDTFILYSKLYLKNKNTRHGLMFSVSDNITGFFQIGQLERMQENYVFKKQKKKNNSPRKRKTRQSKPKNES